MRMSFWTVTLAVLLCSGAQVLRADVWDVGGDNDNDSGSDNELVHGLDQVHDMAAQQGGTVADVDWYPFRPICNRSYEILLDGLTGDLSNGTGSPVFEVIASDASTVVESSRPVSGLGVARRIIYRCTHSAQEITNYVRVSGPFCDLGCVSTDQYQIHFRETTALVPRFNNSATQVSVLVLQNPTEEDVIPQLVAFDAAGTPLAYISLPILVQNQVAAVNLSTIAAGVLAGKSGALKIINDAPYGALAGKVVSVEPATGFTFDTPLVYKAH